MNSSYAGGRQIAAADDVVVPQANSIAVVTAVVDAIADKCSTASEIAEAIGMVGRQGAYYPHAARVLGLVIQVAGSAPVEWQLTERGAVFVTLSAADRVDVLCDALAGLSFIDSFTGGGEELLREEWAEAGLGYETISRRLTTIASWAQFYVETARDEQEKLIESAMTGTRERAPGVRAATRVVHRRVPKMCPSCHLQVASAVVECEFCGAQV